MAFSVSDRPCRIVVVAVSALLGVMVGLTACTDKGQGVQPNPNASRLVGTWQLKARIVDGSQVPAIERQMKIVINEDSTFRVEFRWDDSQQWIRAGQGAISYQPPALTLHWDSRPPTTLLVSETGSDGLVLHHGRNLAPLMDQDPDEIFERQKAQAATGRGPS